MEGVFLRAQLPVIRMEVVEVERKGESAVLLQASSSCLDRILNCHQVHWLRESPSVSAQESSSNRTRDAASEICPK